MSISSPTAERPATAAAGVAVPPLRARARQRPGSPQGEHTARVRFLRRALPAGVGVLLLLLLGWVAGRSILAAFGQNAAPITTVHMSNPHFYGRDSSGRPFSLTAKSATRDARDVATVLLDQPVFILQTGAPKPSSMTSVTGFYREDTKSLILSGKVVLQDSGGWRFDTDRALIDTITGVATGNTGVTGVGPLGQIASSEYAVYDGGAHVIFKGNVRAHMIQSGDKR